MTNDLEMIIFVATFFSLNLELVLCVCGRAEYEINGECCPMCAPGNHVYRHCTGDSSTICVPCPQSTYIAEPSGREKCLTCSVCDLGYSLRIKTQCTRSSDTVCEPLDGFYCTDQVRDGCTQSEEHKTCSPGQYIKEKGTALTDTVCDACPAGTYSNGSLHTCLPHSICEDFGLSETTPGNSSSDAECRKQTPVPLIAGVITSVMVVLAAVVVVMCLKKKYSKVSFMSLNQADQRRIVERAGVCLS